MTRMRHLSIIRRQAYYKPLLRTLDEFGIVDYSIEPPTGRGHAMLVFSAAGGEHRIPLPGTPSGYSSAENYLRNEIRRRVHKDLHDAR